MAERMMCKEYNEYGKTRMWKSCGRSVHFLCTGGHEKNILPPAPSTIGRAARCARAFAGRFA
jgi:hypothetical protein